MFKRIQIITKNANLILEHKKPEEFLNSIEKTEKNQKIENMKLIFVWKITLICCITPALCAILLLFYNYIAILANISTWPF